MDREILYSILAVAGWNKLASWALWGFMPASKRESLTIKCLKCHSERYGHKRRVMTLNPRTAAVKNTMQLLDLSFGSSKPRHYDNNRHPIITVVDRSGIHEIGVSWCRCHEAPKHNMQLMMAGLFPATFHNPKTAFTFWVLEDFHLDNLECKTTPSQFFSRLGRLTNDEFPNTVPVGGHDVSAED